MPLEVTEITHDHVQLKVPAPDTLHMKRLRAAGARAFQPVAIVTRDELHTVILAAREGADVLAHLDGLYREYFE